MTSYQNSLTKTQVPDWPANLCVQSSRVPGPKISPATNTSVEYLGTQTLVKQMLIFWRGTICTCFPRRFPSQILFRKFYPLLCRDKILSPFLQRESLQEPAKRQQSSTDDGLRVFFIKRQRSSKLNR